MSRMTRLEWGRMHAGRVNDLSGRFKDQSWLCRVMCGCRAEDILGGDYFGIVVGRKCCGPFRGLRYSCSRVSTWNCCALASAGGRHESVGGGKVLVVGVLRGGFAQRQLRP